MAQLPALQEWIDNGVGIQYVNAAGGQYQVQHWRRAGFYRALFLELPEYDEAGNLLHEAEILLDQSTQDAAYAKCVEHAAQR